MKKHCNVIRTTTGKVVRVSFKGIDEFGQRAIISTLQSIAEQVTRLPQEVDSPPEDKKRKSFV